MRRLRLIDRYVLRQVAWPLAGALVVTLTALLMERALRLLDQLSASSGRSGYVVELLASLVPHYLGLTLPAAFFIAVVVVYTRLSDGSEVDVLLASGVSLDRIAAPCVAIGLALAVLSLLLSGFLQPESRYAYRAILHAAENGGWSGSIQGQAVVAPSPRLTLTADSADITGRNLRGVFIREIMDDGEERTTTARRGRLQREAGAPTMMLALFDGRQVRHNHEGDPQLLVFEAFNIELPLPAGERLLRARGEDERELTSVELAAPSRAMRAAIPSRKRTAELYGRIARALVLPLLPLFAIPLSLATKRGGRAAGFLSAALVLFVFQHLLQLGQSLGASGKVPPLVGVGAPLLAFAGLSAWIFLSSRTRPGETPVSRGVARLRSGVDRLAGGLRRMRGAPVAKAAA